MKRLHPLSAVQLLAKGVLFGLGFPILLIGLLSIVLPIEQIQFLVGVAFIFPIVGFAYAIARYLCFRYECRNRNLTVSSGVVARTEREIPYSRVQNVHVHQGIVIRLLGLATVRIETAGDTGPEVVLGYVSTTEAERLQRTVRTEQTESRDAGAKPSTRRLFALRRSEFTVLCLTSFLPGTVLLLAITFPLIADLFGATLFELVQPLGGPENLALEALDVTGVFALAAVLGTLTTVALWALSVVLTGLQYYGHVLGRKEDALVYRRGLVSTRSGTIPHEKIQTLRISESFLIRPLGMAKLAVETAGGGGTGNAERQGRELIIPIARRSRVWRFAHTLSAFEKPAFERPPKRARTRYAVRYTLVLGVAAVTAAIAGLEYWYGPALLLPLALIGAHLKWANRGYYVGENCVVVRSGFWNRTTRIVPYFRLQSGSVTQTVFQRRWNLGSFVIDTASTNAIFDRSPTAFDIDPQSARRIHDECRTRLQDNVANSRCRHGGLQDRPGSGPANGC